MREEEIRLGRFPAIVHTKPILWCLPDLPGNEVVHFCGQRFNRIPRGVDFFGENYPPTCWRVGVNGSADYCCAGPPGQKRRQSRGRGELSEEWNPQPVIAGMLIAQNAKRAAAPEQLNRLVKPFGAVEQFDPGAAAKFSEMLIDVAIAQRLKNRAVANEADQRRKHLRVQFPVSQMTQDENHRSARP